MLTDDYQQTYSITSFVIKGSKIFMYFSRYECCYYETIDI